MRRHGGKAWLVGLAALTLGLGGCARAAGTGDILTGDGSASADLGGVGAPCVATNLGDAYSSGQPTVPIPAGFTPVSATRCQFTIELQPGDGEWFMRIEQSASGDFSRVVTELRKPSARRGGACPAIAYAPIIITLIDAAGTKVVPAVPTGGCGQPLPAAVTAISDLPWQTVQETKVHQLRSEVEVSTHCPHQYKPTVAMEGAAGPGRYSPGAIFGDPTAPLQVCRYTLDPTNPLNDGTTTFYGGVFVGAATLEGAPGAAFVAAVNAAPAVTAPCSGPQVPFALVFPKDDPGRLIMVELGGCHRMDDTSGNLRQLDASVTLPS